MIGFNIPFENLFPMSTHNEPHQWSHAANNPCYRPLSKVKWNFGSVRFFMVYKKSKDCFCLMCMMKFLSKFISFLLYLLPLLNYRPQYWSFGLELPDRTSKISKVRYKGKCLFLWKSWFGKSNSYLHLLGCKRKHHYHSMHILLLPFDCFWNLWCEGNLPTPFWECNLRIYCSIPTC